MKNNKFIKSTLILIIGGCLTKILGFIIKIIYTRIIGEGGVGLFTIVWPTYSLLLTIVSLGFPVAISKFVAEENKSSQKIISSILPITFILNFLIIILMWFLSPFIATTLLKQPDTYILLRTMGFTLPFVSISAILKGYFYGKQRMMPHTVSNVIEQIVRLILIVIAMPLLMNYGVIYAVWGLIALNVFSETAQIITFLCYLPKGVKIRKEEIKIDKSTTKDIMSVSIPTLSSRFIGNIGYFFEPIILINLLLFSGYSSDWIMLEYGAFNAYALQTLLLPSFFIGSISSALIPEISKFHAKKDVTMVKRRFKQAMLFSFGLGLLFSILIAFFADDLLLILYKTTSGVNYMKFLLPIFVLFYIEGPLISTLQALGKADVTMRITFFGMILKLIIIAIGSLCHIGLYGLLISEVVNIIFVVGFNYKEIKKVI